MPRYFRARRRFRRRRSRRGPRSRFRRMRRSLKRRAPIKRAILSNRRAIKALKADKEVKFIAGALWPNSTTQLSVAAHGPSGQLNIGPAPITVDSRGIDTSTGLTICPDLLASVPGINHQDEGNPTVPPTDPYDGSRLGRKIKLRSMSVKLQWQPSTNLRINGNVKCHAMLVLDKRPSEAFLGTAASLINLTWDKFRETTLSAGMAPPGSAAMSWYTRDVEFNERFKILKKKSLVLSRQDTQQAFVPFSATGIIAAGATTSSGTGAVDTQNTGKPHTSVYFGNMTFMIKAPYMFMYPLNPEVDGQLENGYQLPVNHTIRLLAWTEQITPDTQGGAGLGPEVDLRYITKVRFTDS